MGERSSKANDALGPHTQTVSSCVSIDRVWSILGESRFTAFFISLVILLFSHAKWGSCEFTWFSSQPNHTERRIDIFLLMQETTNHPTIHTCIISRRSLVSSEMWSCWIEKVPGWITEREKEASVYWRYYKFRHGFYTCLILILLLLLCSLFLSWLGCWIVRRKRYAFFRRRRRFVHPFILRPSFFSFFLSLIFDKGYPVP